VDQGREIGFTSSNLPLNMAKTQFTEDTESQYADELRRQAYIQTLGELNTKILHFNIFFMKELLSSQNYSSV